MTNNPILTKLAARCFVKIYNTFPFLVAGEDRIIWKINVSHCSQREFEFDLSGTNLDDILQEALGRILEFEKKHSLHCTVCDSEQPIWHFCHDEDGTPYVSGETRRKYEILK